MLAPLAGCDQRGRFRCKLKGGGGLANEGLHLSLKSLRSSFKSQTKFKAQNPPAMEPLKVAVDFMPSQDGRRKTRLEHR